MKINFLPDYSKPATGDKEDFNDLDFKDKFHTVVAIATKVQVRVVVYM